MRRLAWLALPLALAACGEETPVDIGEELLPEDAIRTFEVVLEPSQYLLTDTAFALYGDVEEAPFTILASGYAGTLTSHALARFDMPSGILVVDTLGVSRTDTVPRFVRGEVILVADSVASTAAAGTLVALHNLAEDWDPAAASWTLRGAGTPWTVPGGTVGALVDTALYSPGDTMLLHVDSATIALWSDPANGARGARLSLEGGPARIRATNPRLRLFARSSFKPDTLFTVVVSATDGRFVFTPPADSAAGDLRFSGTPEWRSFLRIRPDLRNATVPCGPGCTVRLVDANISRAELLLQPRASSPGFDPELDISPLAFIALVTAEFPLERTPIGGSIGSTTTAVTRDQYRDEAAPVGLVVTEFLRQAVTDTTSNPARRLDWLALTGGATRTFGYGRFAAQPRLRLVLTTAREIQLP